MQAFKRFANWMISHLRGSAEPDSTPLNRLSRYDPRSRHEYTYNDSIFAAPLGTQGDDFLAGFPRRASQDDYLAGFPSRPAITAVHCWKAPIPPRLPVND